MQDQIPAFSGPISAAMDRESPLIRRAPAYDKEKAKTYIPRMAEIRRAIDAAPGDKRLQAYGAIAPGDKAMASLQAALDGILAGGHHASLIMMDLETASGVCYNANTPFCAQSTIKAIYAGALLESHPGALNENGQYLHDAIVYSSNEAYERLRTIYGNSCIRKWCQEAGVDASMADPLYPRHKTARDMLKLWTRLYCFLNGESIAAPFGAYYADSIASAAAEQLGGRYPLQTKAGWENGLPEDADYDPNAEIPLAYRDNDPLNDECAINDTGVIYTAQGPYLFVIYTDRPFGIFPNYRPANPLLSLTEALLNVQQSLHRA